MLVFRTSNVLSYICMNVCCKQDGKSPLHLACERGHMDIAAMLIEHGGSVTDKDEVRVITDACMLV